MFPFQIAEVAQGLWNNERGTNSVVDQMSKTRAFGI